jgi:hypothetical protein
MKHSQAPDVSKVALTLCPVGLPQASWGSVTWEVRGCQQNSRTQGRIEFKGQAHILVLTLGIQARGGQTLDICFSAERDTVSVSFSAWTEFHG